MDGACIFLSYQMGKVDGLSLEHSHNELGKLVGAKHACVGTLSA
jgi:hypothetical protein